MRSAVAVAGRDVVPDQAYADLAVTRLTLTDFRNYGRMTVHVEPRSVVLTGPNGAGKTNLLEAISLLGPGRGLRRARMAELARHDAGGEGAVKWAVAAELRRGGTSVQVGTGIASGPLDTDEDGDGNEEGGPPDRRVVRIDGRPAKGPAALGRVVSVRWLTPQMDRLFTDGTAQRRRFLDHLVGGFDATHSVRLSAYERTLRQRSLLLREGSGDATWIGALEETLAELGVAIAAARRDVLARLSAAMAGGGEVYPGAGLGVRGDVESWLDEQPALAAETKFRGALERDRAQDAATGGAATGPHRSDLEVWHEAGDLPAAQCSTGEQKAILIAIVLADVRLLAATTGFSPLVLLDEVAAHLDEARRDALLDLFLGVGAQVWATGTDARMFAGLRGRAQFLEAAEGRINHD